jgi:hypothetical protein
VTYLLILLVLYEHDALLPFCFYKLNGPKWVVSIGSILRRKQRLVGPVSGQMLWRRRVKYILKFPFTSCHNYFKRTQSARHYTPHTHTHRPYFPERIFFLILPLGLLLSVTSKPVMHAEIYRNEAHLLTNGACRRGSPVGTKRPICISQCLIAFFSIICLEGSS